MIAPAPTQMPSTAAMTGLPQLTIAFTRSPVIRVNCFAEAGVLYTHSNRMASMASWLGRSWTQAVADQPELDVLIDGRVYPLRAVREESEAERVRILKARGYGYVPDGIQVFALVPRNDPRDSMPE